MHRLPRLPAHRVIALLWLACVQAGAALAQANLSAPTSDAVLEDEPPARRALIAQANAQEQQPDTGDNAWQAAVL